MFLNEQFYLHKSESRENTSFNAEQFIKERNSIPFWERALHTIAGDSAEAKEAIELLKTFEDVQKLIEGKDSAIQPSDRRFPLTHADVLGRSILEDESSLSQLTANLNKIRDFSISSPVSLPKSYIEDSVMRERFESENTYNFLRRLFSRIISKDELQLMGTMISVMDYSRKETLQAHPAVSIGEYLRNINLQMKEHFDKDGFAYFDALDSMGYDAELIRANIQQLALLDDLQDLNELCEKNHYKEHDKREAVKLFLESQRFINTETGELEPLDSDTIEAWASEYMRSPSESISAPIDEIYKKNEAGAGEVKVKGSPKRADWKKFMIPAAILGTGLAVFGGVKYKIETHKREAEQMQTSLDKSKNRKAPEQYKFEIEKREKEGAYTPDASTDPDSIPRVPIMKLDDRRTRDQKKALKKSVKSLGADIFDYSYTKVYGTIQDNALVPLIDKTEDLVVESDKQTDVYIRNAEAEDKSVLNDLAGAGEVPIPLGALYIDKWSFEGGERYALHYIAGDTLLGERLSKFALEAPKITEPLDMPEDLEQKFQEILDKTKPRSFERVSAIRRFAMGMFVYDAGEHVKEAYKKAPGRNFIERAVNTGVGDCDVVNSVMLALLRRADIPSVQAVGFYSPDRTITSDEAHGFCFAAYENENSGLVWTVADATPPLSPDRILRRMIKDWKQFLTHIDTAELDEPENLSKMLTLFGAAFVGLVGYVIAQGKSISWRNEAFERMRTDEQYDLKEELEKEIAELPIDKNTKNKLNDYFNTGPYRVYIRQLKEDGTFWLVPKNEGGEKIEGEEVQVHDSIKKRYYPKSVEAEEDLQSVLPLEAVAPGLGPLISMLDRFRIKKAGRKELQEMREMFDAYEREVKNAGGAGSCLMSVIEENSKGIFPFTKPVSLAEYKEYATKRWRIQNKRPFVEIPPDEAEKIEEDAVRLHDRHTKDWGNLKAHLQTILDEPINPPSPAEVTPFAEKPKKFRMKDDTKATRIRYPILLTQRMCYLLSSEFRQWEEKIHKQNGIKNLYIELMATLLEDMPNELSVPALIDVSGRLKKAVVHESKKPLKNRDEYIKSTDADAVFRFIEEVEAGQG